MSVVVLGGTGWIGPHAVRALSARGHRVALFNRGRTDPEAFPDLEQLRGDRGGDLSALRGRSWDAVLDLSGTRPEWVRESASVLAGSVDHYCLMSTTAVYAAFDRLPADENLPLRHDGADSYGSRKASCEREAEAAFPSRVCLPRAAYAVGPGDPERRLDAWLASTERSPLEMPGAADDAVVLVDVRDLADFLVALIEARATGPFNVATRVEAADLVETCCALTQRRPAVQWTVAGAPAPPMLQLPEGALRYWGDLETRRARDRGFAPRPVAETVADVWRWASEP